MFALAQQSNILDFPTVAPQGKSNEWYTPARYIEAAREVMGSIDLDPASCEMANRVVRAARYYTQAENGLNQEWYGNIWINPPFTGTRLRETWTRKVVQEYTDNHIDQAILCMPLAPDTLWFQPLWSFLLCFPSERIDFYQENGQNGSPNFVSILAYFGPHEQKFIDIFSQFGTIAKRVSQPRHTIATPSLWEVVQ